MVRLLGGEQWAWSASPAIYWYRTEGHGGLFAAPYPARTLNRNLTSLISVSTPVQADLTVDVWAGGGYSDFDTHLGSGDWARSGEGTARSAVLGVRAERRYDRDTRSEPRAMGLGLTMEVTAAWIRQRNGRTDAVPVLRVYFTLGSQSRRDESESRP